ncbi:DNA repair protein RAD51 homolog 4 [Onthophagus taurus]|uniref:DNA repair protein RAD51 homolog 4 n=1 Tax=Onthophagus taurus TaxID=166361 RepID=UPI0039BE7D16
MSRLSTEQHKLLTESMIENLFDKNIYTTFDFVQSDIQKLMGATNLSYKDSIDIKKHLINKNSGILRNGSNYLNNCIKKSSILPTGIKSIDEILGGGILTGEIYEICGPPASGKTHFCLTLAKNIINQTNQNVYFIDTKHKFNFRRYKKIVLEDNINNQEHIIMAFNKLLIKQISTIHDLINSLFEIKHEIENGLNVKVIIIDSLPAILYQFERTVMVNPFLNHLVNILRFVSVEMHISIVVTNILTKKYVKWSNNSTEASFTESIGCGKYWINIPNNRLTFRNELGNEEIQVTLDGSFISKIKKCNLKIINNRIS